MWTIIKVDRKNLEFLKEEFKKKLGKNVIIYSPKLLIQKYKKNKLNYIYVLTPKGISEKTKLTVNFMKRKMKEYDELKFELTEK
jgi:hypothetical protein